MRNKIGEDELSKSVNKSVTKSLESSPSVDALSKEEREIVLNRFSEL